MSYPAHIRLPDGKEIDYQIRRSDKAKSLRLKITAREGLTVIAPLALSEAEVTELVEAKAPWIESHLTRIEEVKILLGNSIPVRPQAFLLPAVSESWQVEYQKTKGKTVGARTDTQGRVLVYGAIENPEKCKAALRRWLTRRARMAFDPWLKSLSMKTGLKFDRLFIRSQRTRWGSWSGGGIISLNCKLLFIPNELVRYVMLHELCHGIERNHTSRFWTHLRQYEPETDLLHGRIRDAWKMIPPWAQKVKIGNANI